MTITIRNETDSALTWIGTSTYSPLDGTTQILEATERIEPDTIGRVKISKSGGTDGLFTIASYKFPQRSSSVHIYAMMPATAGTQATVKLVDHSARNQPQLTDNGENGAATMWYRNRGDAAMTDGPWSDNVVEMKWGIMGPEWKYQPGAGDQEVWRITVSDEVDETEPAC